LLPGGIKLLRARQLRTAVLIAILGPALAALIFALITDARFWGTTLPGPQDILGTLLVWFWYGIIVSYILGFLPAADSGGSLLWRAGTQTAADTAGVDPFNRGSSHRRSRDRALESPERTPRL
jgi:hypothetical protein